MNKRKKERPGTHNPLRRLLFRMLQEGEGRFLVKPSSQPRLYVYPTGADDYTQRGSVSIVRPVEGIRVSQARRVGYHMIEVLMN